MTPFAPVGEKSRATLLVELAEANLDGRLLPYAEMTEAIGVPDDRDGRHAIYQATRQANKRLLSEHQRYLVVVKGEGYRVAEPAEHQKLAKQHESKATRQIENGLTILDNTNLSQLTDVQARQHVGATMVLRGIAMAVAHQQERSDRHEALIRRLAGRAGLQEEVDQALGLQEALD